MYAFEYKRPSSADEAARMLGGEAKILAGGQSLIPSMKLRLAQPSALVDLGRIAEMKGVSREGDDLVVGAMTPHAVVEAEAGAIPALAKLASRIGDPQVRNTGTLGGSIANNDPAADYPAALVGLGATVVTTKREIAADDFFVDLFETALEEDEIITKVRFPLPERAGYAKQPNPASRFAIVGVFVAKTGDGVRVAVTGAGPYVFRVPDMEKALASDFSAGALDGISVSADDLNSDIHGSAEYRAHLVSVMAKRAVTEAAAS